MARSEKNGSNVVNIVNCMLNQLHIDKEVSRLEDVTPSVFLSLFEELIGEKMIGIHKPALSKGEEETNCRLILDKLTDIVGVSLDHISPRALVSHDPVAVANLSEIFSGLMEQLMDAIFSDESAGEISAEGLNAAEFPVGRQSTSITSDRVDKIEARYPNVFSAIGRDRIAGVIDSISSRNSDNLETQAQDEDLESLLNVDVGRSLWHERSPLRDRKPLSCRPEVSSSSFRKVAKVAPKKPYQPPPPLLERPTRRTIHFNDLPQSDESTNIGVILDRSTFKSTMAEIKSELANEKAELARRLNSVKARYHKAEFAAKSDAEETRFALRNRGTLTDLDLSAASHSCLGSNDGANSLACLIPRQSTKKKPASSFSNVGFLSRTRADEKKKLAVKRLCEKYKASKSSPDHSTTSPTTGSRRDLIARLQIHFPGLELDDATSRRLWAEYSRHVQALGRVAESARATTRKHGRAANLAQAERQQQILLKIVRREMAQAKRIREEGERRQEVISSRNRVEDSKIQRLRSQRYYSEFVEQSRARMANKQFGEEALFRSLFREAIKAQRERLLDLASVAREVAVERDAVEANRAMKLRSDFQSRLRLLNDKVSNERQIVEVREREQARYLTKMKREMRSRLESELRGMQSQMAADYAAERVAFRELDAEAIRLQIYGEAKQTQPFLK